MLRLRRFDAAKLRNNCKLGTSRIRLIRNKKLLALQAFRREVADLLRTGRHGNARIRVENVIRETLLVQAYDTLEVYLELLGIRAEQLSKTEAMPADMMECICSIIYAAHRISSDLLELGEIQAMLVAKYNRLYKDFALAVADDTRYREWQVNEGLVSCLSVEPPGPEEKIMVLKSICEEHAIPFDEDAVRREMGAVLPSTGKPSPVIAAPQAASAPTYSAPTSGWAPAPEVSGWRPAHAETPPPPQAATLANAAKQDSDEQYTSAEAAEAAAARYHALAATAEAAAARLRAAAGGIGGGPTISDASGGAPTSAPLPPRFVHRSESEIQRQYDDAPGYPAKEPSAPPSAPFPGGDGGPAAPPSGSSSPSPADTGFPSVPGAGASATPMAGAAHETDAEIAELARRLEALKRR